MEQNSQQRGTVSEWVIILKVERHYNTLHWLNSTLISFYSPSQQLCHKQSWPSGSRDSYCPANMKSEPSCSLVTSARSSNITGKAVHSHHFLDDFSQGAALYVLCDEIQSLVFVENADEFEHVRVIQAAHHFDLMMERPNMESELIS